MKSVLETFVTSMKSNQTKIIIITAAASIVGYLYLSKSRKKTLTEREVLNCLEILAERMISHTDSFALEFIRTYGIPNSPDLIDAFQSGMAKLSEEAEKIVLKKLLISPLEFQSTVTKLRQNGSPKIENAIRKMQIDNQARLKVHGIQV
mmetsp:Transcript_16556/g.15898  ORF Transcript_16556/g.15898 Transcript_16556/m.15898 type:complete len:149 (+) Transcript_16556:42-488(+)